MKERGKSKLLGFLAGATLEEDGVEEENQVLHCRHVEVGKQVDRGRVGSLIITFRAQQRHGG